MKLSKIIEIFPALQSLSATKLPAMSSYRVAKALNKVAAEVREVEAARIKLAEELGTKSEDGTRYEFTDGNAKLFAEQYAALLDEECELVLSTVTPEQLGEVAIEPNVLALLDGVVIVDDASGA